VTGPGEAAAPGQAQGPPEPKSCGVSGPNALGGSAAGDPVAGEAAPLYDGAVDVVSGVAQPPTAARHARASMSLGIIVESPHPLDAAPPGTVPGRPVADSCGNSAGRLVASEWKRRNNVRM